MEAACDVGEVRVHWGLRPEEAEQQLLEYADETSHAYVQRYVPPLNYRRAVNFAIIELLNVREVSLPVAATARRVRGGWVANFGSSYIRWKGL